MNKIYKILASLINYPREDLIESLDLFSNIIKTEELLSKKDLKNLTSLIDYLKNTDLLDLQTEYVNLFDRGRAVSLHLFEHIHGESRDRGQAMVDLSNLYQENGLEINAAELPDFLPLFLEFLSTIDEQKAIDYLGEPIDIIALIGIRLKQKKSPYHIVFSILENLSTKKARKITPKEAIIIEKNNEQIDEEWEDPQVTFLGNKEPSSCGSCAGSCSS